MKDITITIKTFERPKCLERLLESISRGGWGGPVLVADDSLDPQPDRVLAAFGGLVTEYLCMAFNSGASAGRNLLLRQVTTPYMLLCDDDFVFDDRTDINRLRDLIDSFELDLIGGVYYDRMHPDLLKAAAALARLDWYHLLLRSGIEIPRKTYFNFEPCDGHRWRLKDIAYTRPVVRCDFVSNFFLARTQALIQTAGGWEESLKVGQHQEFFFRAQKAGLRVGHTEEVGVLHLMEHTPLFKRFRRRGSAMIPKMFAKATLRQRALRAAERMQIVWKRRHAAGKPH
jgi:glycosyltransferase involved in cell wall biosynthesis